MIPKTAFMPQLTKAQQKGLFLFSLLIFGVLGFQYGRMNQNPDLPFKDLPSDQKIAIEIKGPVHRNGLLAYGQPPTVHRVIEDAGGLLLNYALPPAAAGSVLDHDSSLTIMAGRDGPAFLQRGPLSAKARWILGRPIPLNQAGAEDLDRLPGIGPKMAQRIIAFRETQGGFSSLDQLKDVSGIKEKTFEKIKGYFIL